MEVRKYKHAFIVGTFILLALVIFIVTVFTLGGEKKSFSRKFSVKLIFSEINGLKKGNNVWFAGVKIGTVTKIELTSPSTVEVTVSVEKKSQPFIKQNAMAKIGTDGFLGNKIVIIYGGTSDAASIEEGGYLKAQRDSLTTENILATLQLSNKNLFEITNNIKSITEQIKNGKGAAGKLISDPALAGDLQAVFSNFRLIAAKGKNSMENIRDFTARIDADNSSINRLFADTVLYDSVKLAIVQLRSFMQKANDFADHINTVSNNLTKISGNLLDTNNTAGLVMNDKQTAEDIRIVIQNLKSSSKKLDEDLEALQHNFLLSGYFKKKNKDAAAGK